MKKDMNVYKKVGRRYIPFGRRYDENYLSDGIWYVKHNDYCSSRTNIDYIAELTSLIKVGECPEQLDITRALQRHDLAEMILRNDEFVNFTSKAFSVNDLVHKVVSILDEMQG